MCDWKTFSILCSPKKRDEKKKLKNFDGTQLPRRMILSVRRLTERNKSWEKHLQDWNRTWPCAAHERLDPPENKNAINNPIKTDLWLFFGLLLFGYSSILLIILQLRTDVPLTNGKKRNPPPPVRGSMLPPYKRTFIKGNKSPKTEIPVARQSKKKSKRKKKKRKKKPLKIFYFSFFFSFYSSSPGALSYLI